MHARVGIETLRRVGFLTLPGYSMIALANALEPLRMANRLSGETVYEWRVTTLDGAPAAASNGLNLAPTVSLAAGAPYDVVFVCGGVDVREATGRRLGLALRRLSASGVALGALCTGAFALAEARLLDGYRCAIHWENLAAVREEFPDTEFVESLYAIDRDRLTCTGGVAPLHMMLRLIEARLGPALTRRISAQFILDREREAAERQTPNSGSPALAGAPHLERAVRLIEQNAERPVSAKELARAAQLSERQLERLFKARLGASPSAYAAGLRLDRARDLLRQTAWPITQVGLACGFSSATRFSSAYRRRFGHPPRAERAERR